MSSQMMKMRAIGQAVLVHHLEVVADGFLRVGAIQEILRAQAKLIRQGSQPLGGFRLLCRRH